MKKDTESKENALENSKVLSLSLKSASSRLISVSEVKKLPFTSFFLVFDKNEASSWFFPYRDSKGILNKHLLSKSREELSSGNISNIKKNIGDNPYIRNIMVCPKLLKFIQKIYKTVWPGIPPIEIHSSWNMIGKEKNYDDDYGIKYGNIFQDADDLAEETKNILQDIEEDLESIGYNADNSDLDEEEEEEKKMEEIREKQQKFNQERMKQREERSKRGKAILENIRRARLKKQKAMKCKQDSVQLTQRWDIGENTISRENNKIYSREQMKDMLIQKSLQKSADGKAMEQGFKNFDDQIKSIEMVENSLLVEEELPLEHVEYESSNESGESKIPPLDGNAESNRVEPNEKEKPTDNAASKVTLEREECIPMLHNEYMTVEENFEKDEKSEALMAKDAESVVDENTTQPTNERYRKMLEMENSLVRSKIRQNREKFFNDEASEDEEQESYNIGNYGFGFKKKRGDGGNEDIFETDLVAEKLLKEDLENIVDEVDEDAEKIEGNKKFHFDYVREKEQKELEELRDDIKHKRLMQRRRLERRKLARENGILEDEWESDSSDEEMELARQERYRRLDAERRNQAQRYSDEKLMGNNQGNTLLHRETVQDIDEEIAQQKKFARMVKKQKLKKKIMNSNKRRKVEDQEEDDMNTLNDIIGEDFVLRRNVDNDNKENIEISPEALEARKSFSLHTPFNGEAMGAKSAFIEKTVTSVYIFKTRKANKKQIYHNRANEKIFNINKSLPPKKKIRAPNLIRILS